MRRIPVVTVLGFLLVVAPATSSAQQSAVIIPSGESAARVVVHVSSSGHGEVRVTPDHAVITAVIETRSDSAAAAATENTRRYDAIVRALQGPGMSAERVSSPGYTVTSGPSWPMFNAFGSTSMDVVVPLGAPPTGAPISRPPARAPSAVARRSMRVEVARLADVDRAMSAVLSGGATQAGVQLEAPSLVSAQQVAVMAAMADARTNADAMARGAGGTLGRLVDINTNFSPFGGVVSYLSTSPYENSPYGGIAGPPVVRDITVAANVTVRWEIVMPGAARVP